MAAPSSCPAVRCVCCGRLAWNDRGSARKCWPRPSRVGIHRCAGLCRCGSWWCSGRHRWPPDPAEETPSPPTCPSDFHLTVEVVGRLKGGQIKKGSKLLTELWVEAVGRTKFFDNAALTLIGLSKRVEGSETALFALRSERHPGRGRRHWRPAGALVRLASGGIARWKSATT